jgi:hypothetical protein
VLIGEFAIISTSKGNTETIRRSKMRKKAAVNGQDPAQYRDAKGAKKEVKKGNGYAINKDGSISFGKEAIFDKDDPMAEWR